MRRRSADVTLSRRSGARKKFECTYNDETEAFTGAYGTASAIGWEGNHQGVVTCLGGTFFVQRQSLQGLRLRDLRRAEDDLDDADGYLPAQTTSFDRSGAAVSITEFADKLTIGHRTFVAVYSQVAIDNTTGRHCRSRPGGLRRNGRAELAFEQGEAHTAALHEYVVAVDRFGNYYPLPTAAALANAGSYAQHYADMSRFWNGQLSEIAQIQVPDPSLVDAYKAGFIYTEIARSGEQPEHGCERLRVRVQSRRHRDSLEHVHAGLLHRCARSLACGPQRRRLTGSVRRRDLDLLLALGDLPDEDRGCRASLRRTSAPKGPTASCNRASRTRPTSSRKSRTGPGGIMESTDDIDSDGYWTVDDFEALMGLAAYRYIATRVGATGQVKWATSRVRRPARRDQQDPRRDDQPIPPRLPALLDGPAEHGQRLLESGKRQLGGDVPVRQMGMGRTAPRSRGRRSRAEL